MSSSLNVCNSRNSKKCVIKSSITVCLTVTLVCSMAFKKSLLLECCFYFRVDLSGAVYIVQMHFWRKVVFFWQSGGGLHSLYWVSRCFLFRLTVCHFPLPCSVSQKGRQQHWMHLLIKWQRYTFYIPNKYMLLHNFNRVIQKWLQCWLLLCDAGYIDESGYILALVHTIYCMFLCVIHLG